MNSNISIRVMLLLTTLTLSSCQLFPLDETTTGTLVGSETNVPMSSQSASADAECITPVPSVASTPTSSPATLLATRTIPTISAPQFGFLISLLSDETCQLPCYLRITPGQTTYEESKEILEGIGAYKYATTEFIYREEGINKHSFTWWHNVPDDNISQDFSFYVYKGIIFRMEINLVGNRSQIFLDYWDKYSVPSVLVQHGNPDSINFDGHDIWLLFNKDGFYFTNREYPSGMDQLCPGFKYDKLNRAWMLLFDPSSPDLLTASSEIDKVSGFNFEGNQLVINHPNQAPIETTINITAELFVGQLQEEPFACFPIVVP